MKQLKSLKIGLASLMVIASVATLFAQDQPQWKVGDRVETYNPITTAWERATIIKIEDWRQYGRGFWYRVRLDNAQASTTEWATTPDRIRALETGPAPNPAGGSPAGANTRPTANGGRDSGRFAVGDRVDYPDREGRATVIEIGADGRYKVRLDGCKPYLGERWVDRTSIRSAPTVSADNPDVRYLFGSWALFEPGAFNTVTRGDQVYREWGMGGKAPPLQINADGTYIWKEDSQRTTRGKWRTDARVTGIARKASESMEGNAYHDGVVIKDAEGVEWKVYKVVIAGKARDSLVVARICQEANMLMGTRIR